MRFGLFISAFFAAFKALEYKLMVFKLKPIGNFEINQDWIRTCLAGGLASFAILFELPGESRWLLAQYTAVRAAQCLYDHYRKKNAVLSRIGDHLYTGMFALSAGQLVYSFVMRPDTLDREYNQFLTRVTRMSTHTIQAFRSHTIDKHIDFATIQEKIVDKYYPSGLPESQLDFIMRRTPAFIDCDLIHPEDPSCPSRIVKIWPYIFRMMLPVYASLHTIPPLVFGLKRVLKDPLKFAEACLKNSLRSSSFMATYILIYQTLLCGHRKLFREGIIQNDYSMNYGIMAFLASISVLIEKPSRRTELAAYVMKFYCVITYPILAST